MSFFCVNTSFIFASIHYTVYFPTTQIIQSTVHVESFLYKHQCLFLEVGSLFSHEDYTVSMKYCSLSFGISPENRMGGILHRWNSPSACCGRRRGSRVVPTPEKGRRCGWSRRVDRAWPTRPNVGPRLSWLAWCLHLWGHQVCRICVGPRICSHWLCSHSAPRQYDLDIWPRHLPAGSWWHRWRRVFFCTVSPICNTKTKEWFRD